MSEWMSFDEELSPGSLEAVEDLLRQAVDEMPAVRSGLRTEIVTSAQKMQREVRFQHKLWGFVTTLLLLAGGLLWWPASSDLELASHREDSRKPVKASLHFGTDSVDWELVESKNQLRRRNLEILQNAF
jgi:hypothetical protein